MSNMRNGPDMLLPWQAAIVSLDGGEEFKHAARASVVSKALMSTTPGDLGRLLPASSADSSDELNLLTERASSLAAFLNVLAHGQVRALPPPATLAGLLEVGAELA